MLSLPRRVGLDCIQRVETCHDLHAHTLSVTRPFRLIEEAHGNGPRGPDETPTESCRLGLRCAPAAR